MNDSWPLLELMDLSASNISGPAALLLQADLHVRHAFPDARQLMLLHSDPKDFVISKFTRSGMHVLCAWFDWLVLLRPTCGCLRAEPAMHCMQCNYAWAMQLKFTI